MNAVMFVMYSSRVIAWQYFDYEAEALKRLLGSPYENFTHMRLVCKPPADQFHGPYLTKEISSKNDEWEKLRRYVNVLTPEQL
jgi:hypothetical protein